MSTYSTTSRYRLSESGFTAERRPAESVKYIAYTVREGDNIERIATRTLGDPMRYWEIADINPQVAFPFSLKPGTVIRLPV
jgi:nucleoid-associated protein YgaU